jgi:hypothetical protein
MDYFELAKNLTARHAVLDAKTTQRAMYYMANCDYRQDCMSDVIEHHDRSDLAFLFERHLYGSPSEKSEAERELKTMVENAAFAYARSQQ